MDNESIKRYVPPVGFLGACERACLIQRGDSIASKYYILGLQKVIFSYIFPLNLNDFKYVFAVFDPLNLGPFRISLISPKEKGIISFDIEARLRNTDITKDSNLEESGESAWSIAIYDISDIKPIIQEPGTYRFVLTKDNIDFNIGELIFEYMPIPLFSDSQIAAIRSNPLALKEIELVIGCNICSNKLIVYTGLEKNPRREADGAIWYSDLPETWQCKCGKSEFKLNYIRENLHALLGKESINMAEVSITKLYEVRALEETYKEFSRLLDGDSNEEILQKFMKNNPILLEQFSPKEIFYKAPILSKNKTDIVIWNQKNEVLLVELENANTRLLKKDGGIAAPLQHALDQINTWLRHIERDHHACMNCIGLKAEDVTKINGIVIAGRDAKYFTEYLNALKSRNFGRIDLLTYDDLLRNLASLIRRLRKL